MLLMPLVLYTSGCSPCVTLRADPPAPVAFYLVDDKGNNIFLASDKGYHPDSLRLTLDSEPYDYLFTGRDEALNNFIFETYPVLYTKTRVRMLLHLNSSDSDTLDIAYSVNRGKCYTDYTYSTFYFNGQEVKRHPETGYLRLQVL